MNVLNRLASHSEEWTTCEDGHGTMVVSTRPWWRLFRLTFLVVCHRCGLRVLIPGKRFRSRDHALHVSNMLSHTTLYLLRSGIEPDSPGDRFRGVKARVTWWGPQRPPQDVLDDAAMIDCPSCRVLIEVRPGGFTGEPSEAWSKIQVHEDGCPWLADHEHELGRYARFRSDGRRG